MMQILTVVRNFSVELYSTWTQIRLKLGEKGGREENNYDNDNICVHSYHNFHFGQIYFSEQYAFFQHRNLILNIRWSS